MNPVLAHVTRGNLVESQHRGAFVVVGTKGEVVSQKGDTQKPVFPRSAIKAFQCLPVIESGAAAHFGFDAEDIALCCSSHNGEADHVRVAADMLKKCGADDQAYECGAHWPERMPDKSALIKAGQEPGAIHNNCSGKHAGMIALARHLGVDPKGYTSLEHPVQRRIAEAMGSICDVDLSKCAVGIDGCSVPTWAYPLHNMALGFARLAAPQHKAGHEIISSVRAHPFLVAGTGRFDTKAMQAVPRLFIKVGAEGVFCGCIPHAGLGFALKVDDGTIRGAEVAVARMLSELDVWTDAERETLRGFAHATLKNWMKKQVGEVHSAF